MQHGHLMVTNGGKGDSIHQLDAKTRDKVQKAQNKYLNKQAREKQRPRLISNGLMKFFRDPTGFLQ